MSEPIVNIDLAGLELSKEEMAHISKVAHDAVMAEVARLSKAKGKAAAVDAIVPGRPHIIGLLAVTMAHK